VTQNIGRGGFPSVPDLIASIEYYLCVTNANPKPLIWTASAESVLRVCIPGIIPT
jgi:hypothetical protein